MPIRLNNQEGDRMQTFTFISKDKDGDSVTVETGAVALTDILDSFKRFLQGSGFCIDGEIEVVKDEITYGE